MYSNHYLTDKMNEDEVIFAVSVADVQYFAQQKLGRKLNYSEMCSVKKGVEWGLDYWDYIVDVAISELLSTGVEDSSD